MSTDIFCANLIIFLGNIEENKSGRFLLRHCVVLQLSTSGGSGVYIWGSSGVYLK